MKKNILLAVLLTGFTLTNGMTPPDRAALKAQFAAAIGEEKDFKAAIELLDKAKISVAAPKKEGTALVLSILEELGIKPKSPIDSMPAARLVVTGPTPPTTPRAPTPGGGAPAGGIPVGPKPPVVDPVTPVIPVVTPVVDPVGSAGDLKDYISSLAQALEGVVANLGEAAGGDAKHDDSAPQLADYIDPKEIAKLGDFSDAVSALSAAIKAGKPKFKDKAQLLKSLSNAGFNLSNKAVDRTAQENRLNLSLSTLVKNM